MTWSLTDGSTTANFDTCASLDPTYTRKTTALSIRGSRKLHDLDSAQQHRVSITAHIYTNPDSNFSALRTLRDSGNVVTANGLPHSYYNTDYLIGRVKPTLVNTSPDIWRIDLTLKMKP